MAADKKQCFLQFLYLLSLHLRHSSPRFTSDYKFGISVKVNTSNFAHHFVIHWLFQNGANKNQHQDLYQRETILDKFVFFFFKIGKAKKKVNRMSNIHVCMWVR